MALQDTSAQIINHRLNGSNGPFSPLLIGSIFKPEIAQDQPLVNLKYRSLLANEVSIERIPSACVACRMTSFRYNCPSKSLDLNLFSQTAASLYSSHSSVDPHFCYRGPSRRAQEDELYSGTLFDLGSNNPWCFCCESACTDKFKLGYFLQFKQLQIFLWGHYWSW